MILELIATCLLAYGVSTSVVNVNHGNNYDYHNESNEVSLVKNETFNTFGLNTLAGGYNFLDSFNLDEENPIHVSCYFNAFDDSFFNVLLYFNNNVYYLYELDIIQYQSQVSISFSCVDYDDVTSLIDFTLGFYIYDLIDDLGDFKDLYFYVTTPYSLDSTSYQQFNLIFTSGDNKYVVSYNGYYSFLSGNITSFNERFTILGNIIFNNVIYYGFRSGAYSVDAISIDYVNSSNSVIVSIPYQNGNIWFNNVKMTKSNYTFLNSIGVFGYVRPTTFDDSTFNDLLFSIMDSPIYMLSRLLNFELFGVNVFIAFTGLLTLALVVVVIRKIW